MIIEIIEKIEHLPPLPKIVKRLNEVCSSPLSTSADVAMVLEQDAALVADLLKIINSSYLPVRREITSIRQVVALLGRRTIRDFAVAFIMQKSVKADLSPYNTTPEKIMETAGKRMLVSGEICRFVSTDSAEQLRFPALLMDLGKFVIAEYIVEQGKTEAFGQMAQKTDRKTAERAFIGEVSEKVTGRLLERWEIDYFIVQSIEWSIFPAKAPENFREVSIILKLSDEIVTGMEDADVVDLCRSFGIDDETCRKILSTLAMTSGG